jgi:hypothetical protein
MERKGRETRNASAPTDFSLRLLRALRFDAVVSRA